MGRKLFGSREVLASTDVQSYLMDQAVMRFPSGIVADQELPPAAREDGMVRYLEDVRRGEWWDATAANGAGMWRWAYGHGAPTRAILEDLGAAVTAAAGGAEVATHPDRVIDPAALFGAGFGARVDVHGHMLVNPAGPGNADWSLYRVGAPSVVLLLDSINASARTTLKLTQPGEMIAAGATATYRPMLRAGAQNVTTVPGTGAASNPAWNRVRYVVHPILP